MTCIVACPQSRLGAVLAGSGAGWIISALSPRSTLPDYGAFPADRRLHLVVSDIVEPMRDHVLAGRGHIDALLRFLAEWDGVLPLLTHCYAGVSRSPAVAFVARCALMPEIPEAAHARRLRAASPTATPNRHMVALADEALGRQGRMVSAIAAIGRGAECFEGEPFALPLIPDALDGPTPDPA